VTHNFCTTRRISIAERNETSLDFTYCHHLKETACASWIVVIAIISGLPNLLHAQQATTTTNQPTTQNNSQPADDAQLAWRKALVERKSPNNRLPQGRVSLAGMGVNSLRTVTGKNQTAANATKTKGVTAHRTNSGTWTGCGCWSWS
jgi:hypothetical protein